MFLPPLRRTAFTLGLAAIALSTLNCQKSGSDGKEYKDGTGRLGNQSLELKLWIMPNTAKPTDIEPVLDRFRSENPGTQVKVSVLDWSSAWTKITTAAIAGDGPDVVQLGTSWCASLTDMGAFLPLDDLASSLDIRNTFVPSTWENAKPRASEHITSLPWFIDVRPLFYRSDVLAKAKVDATSIRTWDDFVKALETIKAAGVKHMGETVEPLGFPGKNDWNVVHNFASWIWGAGGDFLNATGDECTLNSRESMHGIMAYLDLVRKGLNNKTNLEKNTAQISADFDAGRLAMLFETTTKNIFLNLPPEQGGLNHTVVAKNYGVMTPPAGPGGTFVFMGGSHLAVFKSSKHPEAAKALVQYLTADTAAQLQYAKISGFLPSLNKAFEDPYFSQDPKRKIFKELVAYGKAYASVPYWGEIETSILTRRLGNLFDLAAGVAGNYSEKAVRTEVDATVREINGLIVEHFKSRPEHKEIMQRSSAERSAAAAKI